MTLFSETRASRSRIRVFLYLRNALFKIPKIFRWCYYFCVWLAGWEEATSLIIIILLSSFVVVWEALQRIFFIMSLLIYEEFLQRATQTVLPSQWSVTTENLLKWCIKCWLFVLKCMCAVNAADELLSSYCFRCIIFSRSSAIFIREKLDGWRSSGVGLVGGTWRLI